MAAIPSVNTELDCFQMSVKNVLAASHYNLNVTQIVIIYDGWSIVRHSLPPSLTSLVSLKFIFPC